MREGHDQNVINTYCTTQSTNPGNSAGCLHWWLYKESLHKTLNLPLFAKVNHRELICIFELTQIFRHEGFVSPPNLALGNFNMLGKCVNHYTTYLFSIKYLINQLFTVIMS